MLIEDVTGLFTNINTMLTSYIHDIKF